MKTLFCSFMLFLILPVGSVKASSVDIAVVKQADQQWILSYQASEPVTKLAFVRNPDKTRTERWEPVSDGFHLIYKEGQEYLLRKDGAVFSEVSVRLTPTYTHLAKDYAPFSPFSDGGTLIYTGRLFACANTCDDNNNQWQFSLQVPDNEHILIDGQTAGELALWTDSDNGMNVYVGSQTPLETQNVVAMVDPGLPENMKHALDTDIPELMLYFEQQLGKINGKKPVLFASYANVNGHSSQGGTLPNQIFMHWNVNNLHQKTKDSQFLNDTLWFFAHEVAHLYQFSGDVELVGNNNEAWLHEGHADWLAAKALLALYPDTDLYVKSKIERAKVKCIEGLDKMTLNSASTQGRFDLYYTCGLVIHQAVDKALHTHDSGDSASVWRAFSRQAEQLGTGGIDVFLAVVQGNTSESFAKQVRLLVEKQQGNPEEAIEALMSAASQQ